MWRQGWRRTGRISGRCKAIGGSALGGALAFVATTGQAQTASVPPPLTPAPTTIGPGEPLAPMPDIGVEWPDLSTAPQVADERRAAAAAQVRYNYRIDGVDLAAAPLLRQRFADLSVLAKNEGDRANAAQLDRRAREDQELLVTLLRAEGYYDAAVTTSVERDDTHTIVVLAADTGIRYRLAEVSLAGVDAAGTKAPALIDAFGVKQDDPADADTIAAASERLHVAIGAEGFPFARVGEPELTVDHAAHTATLALTLDPGGARRFGRITANPDNGVFDAAHVAAIARFDTGDQYTTAGIDDLRRALVQTGLVSTARVTPVPGAMPDTVDVAVELSPAPPRTVAAELGYGTGEGARAALS